jgi:hypothetical protein
MNVETSGVVMFGVCDIQTGRCLAKEGAPITAVWSPSRKQINVCGACLDEQLKTGTWKIEGARHRELR